MKHILFFLLTITAGIVACSSAKKAHSSEITEGIAGRVTEVSGNRMPMKDAAPQAGRGVLTNVLIYEPTKLSQVSRIGTSPVYTAISTKLVASVRTDSTGSFAVTLPPGSYSVFIQRDKQYYANLFDVNNNIALFTVETNKITRADLTINTKASY